MDWKAGVVNLFYWCNWMHDRLYQLGFTEAAGNFQFANEFDGVNRGGVGGDPLLADAQRNADAGQSTVYNNGFIYVPPEDGASPWMFIFNWDGPTPDRDGSLDAEVVVHEYTHGLSTRRVGGGAGLSELQSAGLGEGWSDFMALALLSESPDNLGGNYATGAYSTYQFAGLTENYYYGIRRYPYSTNFAKNPLTFKDIDPTQADPHDGIPRSPLVGPALSPFPQEVHNQGEVWCAALWEARVSLVGALGFVAGNERTLKLVVEGMNLAPPNPTFVQARDAILQADQVLFQGDDVGLLWAAFAKRGLGYSAAAPGSSTTVGVAEGFDVPGPSAYLWRYQTGQGIWSSPALGMDGTIYFGSADGKLYALNPNGTKKWEFPGGTNGFGGLHPFLSSPAVGPDGAVYIGSYDHKLYAVNPDGTLKWSFTAGEAIFSSPAIGADSAVYFGCQDGKLYAVNPEGTLRWVFSAGDVIDSSPAIDWNGVIYVGSLDYKLYAINPDGTQKWNKSAGDWVFTSPAVAWRAPGVDVNNGVVCFGSYDGYIYSVNASDGDLRWQFLTGGSVVASPVLDIDGNIYVGSEDGKLYSLAPDGTLRWSFQAGGPVTSSPAIGWDGRVYVCAGNWTLYVLRTNGTLLTSFTLGGSVFSSPVVGADGRVYVGCLDSRLYSYPAETLLAPSPWPMFRNDARHLGNQGFLWFDGGGFDVDGWFQFRLHSSSYRQSVVFEWSNTLTNWNLPRPLSVPSIGTPTLEGVRPFTDSSSIGHDRVLYRARGSAYPFFRSRNSYGFIKVTVPPGDSMIANPLNTRLNTLNGLMPNVPAGTSLYKWNETQQAWEYHVFEPELAPGWSPDGTLLPGEGAYVYNPTAQPFVVTFIGEVLEGYLERRLPAGAALASAMVPQAGGLTTLLGFGPEDGLASGDRLQRLSNPWVNYVTYLYQTGAGWSRTNPPAAVPLEPQPGYGEAFFINAGGPRTWKRTFSVWP